MNATPNKSRGELTIFLGAATGVGKTVAMLEAAHDRRRDGVDVLVGWLNTQQHADAPAWLRGLPVLATQWGQDVQVETIIQRAPQLVVIDELAHNNSARALRTRRYLDVDNLLSAGIDVYTTLNVQEIESLKDIVAQITGIIVTETVPDTFLERANRIQLIDIPPEELIQRFYDGKVGANGDDREGQQYYRPGNLIALRELVLRYTAQRVDRQLEDYMRSNAIPGPWPVADKVMVCISASPFSTQLVRVARQMATSLKAEWIAVYVETARRFPRTERDGARIERHLRMAEELGAEAVTVTGENVAAELLSLARKRNVKQIIIGKPRHSRLWEWLHGSVVDQVIRQSHGISVHVLPGQGGDEGTAEPAAQPASRPRKRMRMQSYALVALFVGVLTVLLRSLGLSFDLVNIALLYLFPVLISAVRWGLGPSSFAAVAGLIAFDLFFVPPFYSFAVADLRYLVSFAVFLTVAALTASLASRLRHQLRNVQQREAVTASLYALSREMTAVTNLKTVTGSIVRQVADTFGANAAIFLPDATGELQRYASSAEHANWGLREADLAIARWVFQHGDVAGRGTETLRESPDLYVPLATEEQIHGVLAVNFESQTLSVATDRLRLIEALSGLGAVAIARVKLEEDAKVAHLVAESERLRTALLDSISHELRTPLATITGSVSGLLEHGGLFNERDRQELLLTIQQGALRMDRLVTNLLGMVRLESGLLQLRKRPCDIEDIIGVSLAQIQDTQPRRTIHVHLPAACPLIEVDEVLLEQVLVNVLSNAIKYSPDLSDIVITGRYHQDTLTIEVADVGIGIAAHEAERVFEKFYRSAAAKGIPGTGLGLAICRGIIEAHGGTIGAHPNGERGTVIIMTLPVVGARSDGHEFAQDTQAERDARVQQDARGELGGGPHG